MVKRAVVIGWLLFLGTAMPAAAQINLPDGQKLQADTLPNGELRQIMRLDGDVAGTTTVLDTLDEIVSAPLAGLNAVSFEIPSGATFDGVIKPVICSKDECSATDAADYTEDQAVFIDGNGNPSSSLTLENPTDAYILTIASAVNARRVAIKATTVNSGSVTITPIATVSRNWQVPLGSVDGTSLAPFPLTQLPNGDVALRVDMPRSVGNVPLTRAATPVTFDSVNDEIVIDASGAGYVFGAVESGLTGTVVAECRRGSTGTWAATPFMWTVGDKSTFPMAGFFLLNDCTEYKLRASAASAGSATAKLWVSPGPAEIPSKTCYITSAASNNATNCKDTPGIVTAIQVTNTTGTAYYLRMYNDANVSGPTCSSATGFVETIPALANDVNGRVMSDGELYPTGIGFCLTGGGSSTDNTDAATGLYVTIKFR